ncbi:MAG: outer membrane beta-barrel protein [Bacteroidales bacterium]
MGYKKYIITLLLSFVFVSNLNAQRYLENAIRRPDDHRNKIRLGLRLGANISDLTSANGLDIWNGLMFWDINREYIGFTDTKSKLGFNAGITAQLKLWNRWYVQTGLVYTMKGYEIQSQQVNIDVNAHYIQLPLEMIYKYPIANVDLLVSGGLFLGVGVNGMTHFYDHYGEGADPRKFHDALQKPYINEKLGIYNLIGCDHTVHGANVFWSDDDDTFLSEGTYRIDGGVQVGLGFEYKSFQFMFNYQYSLTPLYDYDHDFSYRYTTKAKNENVVNPTDPAYSRYYNANGKPYNNSFEYFSKDVITSPHHHVISFTISFFFDKFKHGLKL